MRTETKEFNGRKPRPAWLLGAAAAALILLGGLPSVHADGGGALQPVVASQSETDGVVGHAVNKKGRTVAKARNRLRMRLH
jgi:hypothetical protein